MKKFALFALAALSFCGMATAQTLTTGSTATLDVNTGQTYAPTVQFTSPADTTARLVTEKTGTDRSIVEYQGDYTIKNVPSVNGPNLTTSNDTCMGSTSGSANGAGFGIGFGTTWTDEHCKNLKMSRELWNKGMKAASLALDCENLVARKALEMTGTKCPQSMTAEERVKAFGPTASVEGAVPAPVVASAPAAQVVATPVKGYTGNDPIVISRMGGYANK